ncbi:MAG TPA: hypothetical protein VIJ54_07565 [Actinomycetes bacterium]|jgi:DNA-binding FadR family transcriptional regulator
MTPAEQQTIEDAHRVVAEAAKVSERISETLARSREVTREAIRVLRRAGYNV